MTKIRRAQVTDAVRKQLSTDQKSRWANPAYRAKMCLIRRRQSQGNQLRHPKASFYRKMYEGPRGKFWMRSSWEVAFAQWLDHTGVHWEYESRKFNLGNHRFYTPDFYLPDQDEYVEIKGWLTDKDKKKIIRFRELYPDIKLYVFFEQGLKAAKIIPFRKAA